MSQTHTHALSESIFARAISELRAQASRVNAALLALESLSLPAAPPPREYVHDCVDCRRERRSVAQAKPAKTRKAGRNGATPKSSPPPAKTVPARPAAGRKRSDNVALIYQAIAGGAKTSARIVEVSGVPKGGLHAILQRLLREKRIVATRQRDRSFLYSAPSRGAAASSKAGDPFETVWDGRKSDPSLLGDRPTRSA